MIRLGRWQDVINHNGHNLDGGAMSAQAYVPDGGVMSPQTYVPDGGAVLP